MIYMICSSWDKEQDILKLVILGHLLPLYSYKNPKIKILKNEKIYWRYHFTQCTKNHSHVMYSSWDTEWDRQNFLSSWAIFWPLSLLTTWKIKILEKWTTPEDIIILQVHTINDSHMMYCSWDINCNRQNFLNHFGPFFALLPP